MRCYEYLITSDWKNPSRGLEHRESLIDGLSIRKDTEQPYVSLWRSWFGKAPDNALASLDLSNDLANRFSAYCNSDTSFGSNDMRLMRCDLENRSQLWLVPETSPTTNSVLIHCTVSCKEHIVSAQTKDPKAQLMTIFPQKGARKPDTISLLAILPLGSSLEIDYAEVGFLSWIQGPSKLVRRLSVELNGNLAIQY